MANDNRNPASNACGCWESKKQKQMLEKSSQPVRPSRAFYSLRPLCFSVLSTMSARALQCNEEARRLSNSTDDRVLPGLCPAPSWTPTTTPSYSSPHLYPLEPSRTPSPVAASLRYQL